MSETIDKQKLLSEINERRKADFIALKPDDTRNQMRCEMWAEFYDMVEKFDSSSDQTEPSVDRVREEMKSIFESWNMREIANELEAGYSRDMMLELIGLCENLIGLSAEKGAEQ